MVALAFAAALPLLTWRGKVNQVGQLVVESITLITSDRENLSCALGRAIGRYRCAFRAPKDPWPGELPRTEVLAPYVATGPRTFLVPGLFEQPALVARYATEPPAGKPRDQLQRFSVRCTLRLLQRLDEVQARWSRDWDWGPQTGVWVAEPVACVVE